MRFYKFDEFKIDTAKRKLFCNGQEIGLRDRDFDVLLHLVKNRNRTCSKDAIIKSVWEGTIVEDNSVERAIVNVRKVLGDSAADPWFIKTVRGKGYLFICDVEEFDDDEPQSLTAREKLQTFQQTEIKDIERSPKWIPSAIFTICLVGIFGFFWWNNGTKVFAYLTNNTVFTEDFSSKKIDLNKWRTEGESVKIHEGIARISVDKLGHGGSLESKFFQYDPDKPLKIKSRVRISYNQSIQDVVYFVGVFGLNGEDDSEEDLIGIKYANAEVEFTREGKVTTEGFYLVKENADLLDEYSHCNGKIGPRTDAIWGDWFEQQIIYEPTTETLSYLINNEKKGEFSVGKLPATADNKLRLNIYPRGSFLHHAIEIDYVEIMQ